MSKIDYIKTLASLPRVAVESGTFRGQTAIALPKLFEVVHTIELSDKLFTIHPKDDRVEWHHGDTRVVLPKLALEIEEPVFWLLDAHYFAGSEAAGKGPLPLWDELQAISPRKFADVVAVDDVHTFGKKRPREYGGWESVSANSLMSALGRVVKHQVIGDMFVMWRSTCT